MVKISDINLTWGRSRHQIVVISVQNHHPVSIKTKYNITMFHLNDWTIFQLPSDSTSVIELKTIQTIIWFGEYWKFAGTRSKCAIKKKWGRTLDTTSLY